MPPLLLLLPDCQPCCLTRGLSSPHKPPLPPIEPQSPALRGQQSHTCSTHSPRLTSPVKGPYGFPQASATPTDSQPLLAASRAGMVNPIAQMWKLRPRKVRVGTLGPVPHPRSLLCSVTCGVRVTRDLRRPRGHGPSPFQRHNHTHRHP